MDVTVTHAITVFIGAGALGVITRMMGLILAVIGTQMLIEGIRGAFNISNSLM